MFHRGKGSCPSGAFDIICSNFSMPAQAAITPLSVHSAIGGKINCK